MSHREIYKDDRNYVVVYTDDTSGVTVLQVTCATGFHWYDAAIRMSAEELLAFENDPRSASELGDDICRRPDKYKDRLIHFDP